MDDSDSRGVAHTTYSTIVHLPYVTVTEPGDGIYATPAPDRRWEKGHKNQRPR